MNKFSLQISGLDEAEYWCIQFVGWKLKDGMEFLLDRFTASLSARGPELFAVCMGAEQACYISR